MGDWGLGIGDWGLGIINNYFYHLKKCIQENDRIIFFSVLYKEQEIIIH